MYIASVTAEACSCWHGHVACIWLENARELLTQDAARSIPCLSLLLVTGEWPGFHSLVVLLTPMVACSFVDITTAHNRDCPCTHLSRNTGTPAHRENPSPSPPLYPGTVVYPPPYPPPPRMPPSPASPASPRLKENDHLWICALVRPLALLCVLERSANFKAMN